MVFPLFQRVPTKAETQDKIAGLCKEKPNVRELVDAIETKFTQSQDPNARWQYYQFYKALNWVMQEPHKARIHAADLAHHARIHVFLDQEDTEKQATKGWYERYSQSNKPYILGAAGLLLGSAIFTAGIATTVAFNPVIGIAVALVGALVTVLSVMIAALTKKGPDYSKETKGYTDVFESVARAVKPDVKFEEPKTAGTFTTLAHYGGYRFA